ncbi:MAG: hypothetical protein M3O74_13720 [Pseudomonadota bacterium]|nr:hypothetical protein [Pseudomonadota bacterium]
MPIRTRTGVALTDAARERLQRLAEISGLSQNAVVESLILGITDEELLAIAPRGHAVIRAEKKTRMAANQELRNAVKALSPAERNRLLKLAKDQA